MSFYNKPLKLLIIFCLMINLAIGIPISNIKERGIGDLLGLVPVDTVGTSLLGSEAAGEEFIPPGNIYNQL
jgi:hypothetical protein